MITDRPHHIPDTIVSFNAKVGRGGKAMVQSVREILDDHPSADVLCFQECQGYIDDLRRNFNGGWTLYVKEGWKESQQNPVMVRKSQGFPKRSYSHGWGTVVNTTTWIGPKHGWEHPGRTWTWVKVGPLYVMSLHRATDGDGKNKDAYIEEGRRLQRFLNSREGKPVVIIGDTNTGLRANHEGSMSEIKEQTNGRLIADQDEPGIDYALVSRIVNGKLYRTQHYGSDHKAAVLKKIEVAR